MKNCCPPVRDYEAAPVRIRPRPRRKQSQVLPVITLTLMSGAALGLAFAISEAIHQRDERILEAPTRPTSRAAERTSSVQPPPMVRIPQQPAYEPPLGPPVRARIVDITEESGTTTAAAIAKSEAEAKERRRERLREIEKAVFYARQCLQMVIPHNYGFRIEKITPIMQVEKKVRAYDTGPRDRKRAYSDRECVVRYRRSTRGKLPPSRLAALYWIDDDFVGAVAVTNPAAAGKYEEKLEKYGELPYD